MLAADKLQLQSALKQQATALKEKEFNLHHSNLMTVGTQAAVLAGLDVTMFIEFQPPHDSEWGASHLVPRTLKFFYYCFITAAFCANILVVSQTTLLSVLGAGLALRGPDGSMMTATDGLYEERKTVFHAFGFGLATTVASVLICVWLILSPEAAMVCMSITIFTCFKIYSHYLRVIRRFDFNEDDTVDFTDIFEGPANIRGVRGSGSKRRKKKSLSDDDAPVPVVRRAHSTACDEHLENDESLSSEPESSIESQIQSDNSYSVSRRRRHRPSGSHHHHHNHHSHHHPSTPRRSGGSPKKHNANRDRDRTVPRGGEVAMPNIEKGSSEYNHLLTV